VQGKVEHAQRHPKDINTTPRRSKMVTIDIHSSESRRKMRERVR
jgi:hypothetical protein